VQIKKKYGLNQLLNGKIGVGKNKRMGNVPDRNEGAQGLGRSGGNVRESSHRSS